MQELDTNNDESELIRLLLKRQSELNSLLEVTRAINKNNSTQVLVGMLETILKSYLNVGKLRFMIEKFGSYYCVSKYGGGFESNTALYKACMKLSRFKNPANIATHNDAILSSYDYFIPIYHKNKLLAFALVGDFISSPDMVNNDLNFIQTIMNVIVVALENKKLFRERIEAERFQREMELAVEVQNMLIPIRLHIETGVEIGARYLPHQNIGGDYFDFIRLNEKEFMWCVADVSGKGISAALLMANFQASLRAWATVEDDLMNIIERLNRIVIKITKGEKFITLFLAKYNEETRRLNFINAGHNPSLLFKNGVVFELKLGTTMIGAFDDLPFINQGELDIEPGSLIVNYTDGLLDYEPSDAANWNEDTLIDFLRQNGDMTPDKFNQALLNELNAKVKSKQIDDITLLTLRIFNMLLARYQYELIEAGCDEAGRGCLAGPVYAAAVILPDDFEHALLNDSKQVDEHTRNSLRTEIEERAIAHAVAFVDNDEIDEINILNASFLAMHRALDMLHIKPELLIIDGNRFNRYGQTPHHCIIQGDGKYFSIAAASILAKTYRDDFMKQIALEHPEYDWHTNKGYPTIKHRNTVLELGFTPYHRKTFRVTDPQLALF